MKNARAAHFTSLLVLILGGGANGETTFADSVTHGTVSVPGLVEASGIAVSRSNPGVIWTHNDKGGQPEIFAIDTQGRWLGTYLLPGAASLDYEDIAIGPGSEPGVDYIYLGDIGDKRNAERPNIVVYRIPEPAVYLSQADMPGTTSLKGVVPIQLRFPGTRQNAETLMSDPISGDLFIVTKQDAIAGVFRAAKADLDNGGPITMRFERNLCFDSASGGDISPNGGEIAIRQESFARLWERSPGQSIADALAEPPISIPVVGKPTEKNGEAIGFTASGDGYYTLSDSLATQPLYYFARTSEPAGTDSLPLIERGSRWAFFDGEPFSAGWASPVFDDASWDIGNGQLGFGDGDETTLIDTAGNATCYFRKTFEVADLPDAYRLELRLLFDDGARVYFNGQVAAVANLPLDASHESPALEEREAMEDSWLRINLDPRLLRVGANTVAVEVHQAASDLSDLSFDAQLAVTAIERPRITAFSRTVGGDLRIGVASEGPSVILQSSADLRTWIDLAEIPISEGTGIHAFSPPQSATSQYYRLVRREL